MHTNTKTGNVHKSEMAYGLDQGRNEYCQQDEHRPTPNNDTMDIP